MIDKIIEELEYHKIEWENTDEYNLQRRPSIAVYEKAIEIVKRYEKDAELRIVKNFLKMMPKTYRRRSINRVVVRDILMHGTSRAGSTSCDLKCEELGINPFSYTLESEDSND